MTWNTQGFLLTNIAKVRNRVNSMLIEQKKSQLIKYINLTVKLCGSSFIYKKIKALFNTTVLNVSFRLNNL